MSAIGSIGGSSAPQNAAASGFSALSSEEFVKIIFTELTNQDPLAPSDSKALIDQLASLRSIESDIALTENLNNLVGQTEFAAAAGLVGQVAGGLTLNGDRVLDLVVSVSKTVENGAVLNMLDGSRVPFSFVDEVLGVPQEAQPDPDPRSPAAGTVGSGAAAASSGSAGTTGRLQDGQGARGGAG